MCASLSSSENQWLNHFEEMWVPVLDLFHQATIKLYLEIIFLRGLQEVKLSKMKECPYVNAFSVLITISSLKVREKKMIVPIMWFYETSPFSTIFFSKQLFNAHSSLMQRFPVWKKGNAQFKFSCRPRHMFR